MQDKKLEMRIIGGTYRHRKIKIPDDKTIRPTKDRIRESIFNALSNINDKTFLDLYSGSGAMGIEAISRGASFVLFNDYNLNAIKVIKDNLKTLDIDKNLYKISFSKDKDAIKASKEENIIFDIVFLDPPYKEGQYKEIIDLLLSNNLVSPNGIIITESDYELDLSIEYRKHKVYKYGEIYINIYWR